jgi:putative membrane protein
VVTFDSRHDQRRLAVALRCSVRAASIASTTAHRRARWASVAVAGAAMAATPLLPRAGRTRAAAANVVVAGLAGSALAAAVERWGAAKAVKAFGAITTATLALERLGARTGVPFGRYTYTDRLRPRLGGVPVAVPVAWFAMAIPARAVATAVVPRAASGRVAAAAALLTAWDLFLDPQMVGEGYWHWARAGRYRGIPLTNYFGWLLTATALMTGLERLLPDGEVETDGTRAMVRVYAFVAVMSTLGFAAFFDDRFVALCGGAAMLPPAALAVWRVRGG